MDLIERQAAIDAIEGLPNCYNGFSDSYDKAYIIGVLEELPSAEPNLQPTCNQLATDCISRQGAIDTFLTDGSAFVYGADECKAIVSRIKQLPSAKPEIIYCKNCKRHNVSVQDWYDNHELKVCPLVDHRGKAQGHEFDYQFCAYAERKEDE